MLLTLLGMTQALAQESDYLPLIREGVTWVNEKVIVNHGDTTQYYYNYEFSGKAAGNDISSRYPDAAAVWSELNRIRRTDRGERIAVIAGTVLLLIIVLTACLRGIYRDAVRSDAGTRVIACLESSRETADRIMSERMPGPKGKSSGRRYYITNWPEAGLTLTERGISSIGRLLRRFLLSWRPRMRRSSGS